MSDAIEYLDNRDDVVKTTYTKYNAQKASKVTAEVWHDVDGLKSVFEKAMCGDTSPRGLQEFAEKRALAVRETKVEIVVDLKRAADSDNEFEYERNA